MGIAAARRSTSPCKVGPEKWLSSPGGETFPRERDGPWRSDFLAHRLGGHASSGRRFSGAVVDRESADPVKRVVGELDLASPRQGAAAWGAAAGGASSGLTAVLVRAPPRDTFGGCPRRGVVIRARGRRDPVFIGVTQSGPPRRVPHPPRWSPGPGQPRSEAAHAAPVAGDGRLTVTDGPGPRVDLGAPVPQAGAGLSRKR